MLWTRLLKGKKKTKWLDYWPLGCVVLLAIFEASAIVWAVEGGILYWMHFFMGLFLSKLSLLKLFNISGFADGFQMYDMVAKHSRNYALCYPFIELVLGIAYLAFLFPLFVYFITVVMMGIGTIGVVQSLRAGLDLRCACMGTVLNVPLSMVTIVEDIGMGAMALAMFLTHFV